MKEMIKWLVMMILIIGSVSSSFGQESIMKELVDGRQSNSYALYPSTIRMVNIEKNPDFDEFSATIKKILIYQLEDSVIDLLVYEREYNEVGFEEYARVFGGDTELLILGTDQKMTGWHAEGGRVFMFYLSGQINWQKLPAIIETLRAESFLDVFNLEHR